MVKLTDEQLTRYEEIDEIMYEHKITKAFDELQKRLDMGVRAT